MKVCNCVPSVSVISVRRAAIVSDCELHDPRRQHIRRCHGCADRRRDLIWYGVEGVWRCLSCAEENNYQP